MEISKDEAIAIVKGNMVQAIQALCLAGVDEARFRLVESEPMHWEVCWGPLTLNEDLMDELAVPVSMGPMLLSAKKVDGETQFYAMENPSEIDKKTAIEITLENLAVLVAAGCEDRPVGLLVTGPIRIDRFPEILEQYGTDAPYKVRSFSFPDPEPEVIEGPELA